MEILDDLPRILFLLSFVLIGLFRWIANTIAERRNNDDDGNTDRGDEPPQDWSPPVSAPAKTTPPPQQTPPALPDAMREFFDTVTAAETPAQPAPVPTLQTPPIPASLTKAERDALAKIKQGSVIAYATRNRKNRQKRSNSARLRGLFADPESLKRAFVMKEILDEPKALKSPGTLGSF